MRFFKFEPGLKRAGHRLILVILSFSMLLTPLAANTRPARSADRALLDSGYVPALAAADHFLQAWQAGDTENGLALLTSSAKQEATAERMERFFSAPPSAYEIGRGKLVKHGRYEFPLALVSGTKKNRVRRRLCNLVIVNTANNDWAVDKLP